MGIDILSIYTCTCDRCTKQAVYHSNVENEMKDLAKWTHLSEKAFILFGKTVYLCPKCYEVFEKEFMNFLPPAFKKAMEG